MRTRFIRYLTGLTLATALALPGVAGAQSTYLDQGPNWNDTTRAAFYSQDQGSKLIPVAWLNALTTADGKPFLWDKLARYGYLPNEFRPSSNLPIGFTTYNYDKPWVGMTCSACHTREIEANGTRYRVDGGPAIVDFQAFLTDIVGAVGALTTDDAKFQTFAAQVLPPNPSSDQVNELKVQVTTWFAREDAMRSGAYPDPGMWGLGRLDAISMIFDRLTGIDLAVPPALSIPGNIERADAPTRYPFLWNASRQTIIQWPGFSPNGSQFFGLIRNTGEVYGVFGGMHPTVEKDIFGKKVSSWNSTANWPGLINAERLIEKLGPPKWPWPGTIDAALADQGKTIFKQQCGSCHIGQTKPAVFPFTDGPTIASKQPLVDVGTDSRENDILHRTRDSGILNGVKSFPVALKAVGAREEAVKLLGIAVVGSIYESGQWKATIDGKFSNAAMLSALLKTVVDKKKPSQPNAYESRVLDGIWAAAPYLHNGTVATLADLLEPCSNRPQSFQMGPVYDTVNVGILANQPSNYVRTTSTDGKSGNGRCGHEGKGFGTDLTPDKKKALLEYLKTL